MWLDDLPTDGDGYRLAAERITEELLRLWRQASPGSARQPESLAMEPTGFEPVTSCMPCKRSPS
jgi:hypothetical protein